MDETQRLILNLVSQLTTIKNELVRQDEENKRIYQQIDKLVAEVKTQRGESIDLRKDDQLWLDKRLVQIEKNIQNLAAKTIEREAQLSLLRWVAGGGLSAGGLALISQFINIKSP